MAYRPTSGTLEQHKKANGAFALNYYLKYYAAGTTTAISCAANSSATDENNQPQLLAKVRINENGYPVNASGGEMVPHVDQAYKAVMYKNATDADADNVSAAYWMVDNLSPGLIGFTTTSAETDADQINYQADPTANTRKLDTRMKEMISVTDFGADTTGAVDASTAFATAMLTNYDIYVPEGTYLTSGIKVVRDGQRLHFGAGVTLKASANDSHLFQQQKSDSKHTGTFTVDSNSKSGVYGMVVGPDDLTDTLTVSHQTDNVLPGIIGDSGTEELVVVQPGPDVSGTDSLNFRNRFPGIYGGGAVRVVWLAPPPNGNARISSYHTFDRVDISETSTNTGIHVESGSFNTFHFVYASGITSNGSPSTTATAIRVENTCPTAGTSCESNLFLSGRITGCNRDFDSANSSTRLSEIEFTPGNSQFGNDPVYRAISREVTTVYAGKFNSTLTTSHNPPGFSSTTYPGTYTYQVNHNLGHTNYIATANTTGGTTVYAHVTNITNNYFWITGRHINGSGSDSAMHYMLIAY